MSIESLEKNIKDIKQIGHGLGAYLPELLDAIIDILKNQSDQIANLCQELSKKEDAIIINDKTKIGGND